jgi:hypothetical protein
MADKFDWIKAVGKDTRMGVGERYVLTRIATDYVLYDEGKFYAKQSTVARACAVSLSTVERAMSSARRFGYLTLDAPRRRRGPGCHDADHYRLTLPERPVSLTGNSDADAELPVRSAGVTRQKVSSYPSESLDIPVRANSPTCENDPPKGEEKGLY